MRALAGANHRTDEPAHGRLARTKQLRKLASDHPSVMSHLEVRDIARTAWHAERGKIDQAIAIRRLLDVAIATVFPFRKVTHRAGAHQVQIDVNKAGNWARHAIVRYLSNKPRLRGPEREGVRPGIGHESKPTKSDRREGRPQKKRRQVALPSRRLPA